MNQEQQNKRPLISEDSFQQNKRPTVEALIATATHVRHLFDVCGIQIRVIPLAGADEHNCVKLSDDDMPSPDQLAEGYVGYRQTYTTNGAYLNVTELLEKDDENTDWIPFALDDTLQIDTPIDTLHSSFCKATGCDADDVESICFVDDTSSSSESYSHCQVELVVRNGIELDNTALERAMTSAVLKYFREKKDHPVEGSDPFCPDFQAWFRLAFETISLRTTEPTNA